MPCELRVFGFFQVGATDPGKNCISDAHPSKYSQLGNWGKITWIKQKLRWQ